MDFPELNNAKVSGMSGTKNHVSKILITTSIGIIIFIAIKLTTRSQDHHEWRKQGECLECHSQEDDLFFAITSYIDISIYEQNHFNHYINWPYHPYFD